MGSRKCETPAWGRVTRDWTLAILAACLAGCSAGGGGAAAADPGPARLVALEDGRRINLACKGRGAPVVLLEPGFGAGSGAWSRIQPALARTTRVCAYDRAGSGYSDPGPLPRDGGAIVRDIDQVLTRANVEGPFVVVGHSAGGLYARLFAARRPREVAGLVLLDPTVERRAAAGSDDGLEGIRRRVSRCLALAEATPQAPDDDPRWAGCEPARPSAHQLKVARDAATWRSQLSELNSLFGRTSELVARTRGLMRDVPAYILTASDTANAAPKIGFDKPQSAWELQHQGIASEFNPGYQQTIYSSHMVMTDRPEAVIAATQAMIRAIRAGRPPEPLPQSETERTREDIFKAPSAETLPFKSESALDSLAPR